MPKQSVLQFSNYSVDELTFRPVPTADNIHEFSLSPKFEQKVTDLGDGRYDVRLSMDISPSEDNPLPFILRVALVGHFKLILGENDALNEQIIRRNTISILFPFLRSIVATLTTCANITPLILLVMNFTEND